MEISAGTHPPRMNARRVDSGGVLELRKLLVRVRVAVGERLLALGQEGLLLLAQLGCGCCGGGERQTGSGWGRRSLDLSFGLRSIVVGHLGSDGSSLL